MRSASSTWVGRPEAIRPATYLTSGEYATTSRSRARSSPLARCRRQRSLSSTALTFVSTLVTEGRSRPRVCTCVGGPQPVRLYPSVDLRRGQTGVAQELLNHPQIGTTI